MNDNSPRGWHSRGYLPHFDGGEMTQAITFRLADSLPQTLLNQWRTELQRNALTATEEQIKAELRKRIEGWLDQGHGQCFLRYPQVAEVVQNALFYFDQERYRLVAWVIMPNHVHLILTPCPGQSMSRIMHSLKSFTASEANRLLQRTGNFWQRDYYDRYIRDDKHFAAALAYVENNPVKAGLCQQAADWPFSSAKFR